MLWFRVYSSIKGYWALWERLWDLYSASPLGSEAQTVYTFSSIRDRIIPKRVEGLGRLGCRV